VRRKKRYLILLLLVAVGVAVAVYGFTASNTVTAKAAGDGSGAISGFTVSSVAYTLNSSDPSKIDAVAFSISPASTSTVKVKLDSAGSTWYSCTNSSGSVSCTTTSPQATVAAADELRVVAVG
jgi:hypothetical protein